MSEFQSNSAPQREPVFRVPAIVAGVVAALLAIHALLMIGGEEWQVVSLYLFSFIPARISGSVPYPAVAGSEVWSFVTYALLHGSWTHVLSNSLWFVVFGTILARRLSAWRFLTLCMVGAVGGALGTLLTHWGQELILVGASGSVSALLAAAIPLMYAKGAGWREMQSSDLSHIRRLSPSELITDRRALIFGLVWFGLTLLTGAGGWLSNSFADASQIAWEAHIGGFALGLAGFYVLDRQSDLPWP